MMNMRTERWNEHRIRFVQREDGAWWAVLSDICEALKLNTWRKTQQIPEKYLDKALICEPTTSGVRSRARHSQNMLIVNEFGIYEALFRSQSLEARKFREWSFEVLQKLRHGVGLEGYEVMRMTESYIQDEIDHILDDLFYDEETKKLYISKTVAGGDVEQIPFDEY